MMSECDKCPTCQRAFKKPNPDGYNSWVGLNQRCSNPKSHNYKDYGARGITVCEEWQGRGGFDNFIQDVGPRPSPNHSIERKDVNGNYEPGNVKWATPEEQQMNKTNTVRVEINGEVKTIPQLSEETNIPKKVLWTRFEQGKTGEDLIKPLRQKKYEFGGETLSLDQLSERTGISRSCLYNRMTEQSLSVSEAVALPKGTKKKV